MNYSAILHNDAEHFFGDRLSGVFRAWDVLGDDAWLTVIVVISHVVANRPFYYYILLIFVTCSSKGHTSPLFSPHFYFEAYINKWLPAVQL